MGLTHVLKMILNVQKTRLRRFDPIDPAIKKEFFQEFRAALEMLAAAHRVNPKLTPIRWLEQAVGIHP